MFSALSWIAYNVEDFAFHYIHIDGLGHVVSIVEKYAQKDARSMLFSRAMLAASCMPRKSSRAANPA